MDLLIAPGTVDEAHADTAPATGTPGWATDGSPATGVPATQWPAYAFNAVQAELTEVITGAGLLPDRNDNGQVLTAINKIVDNAMDALLTSGNYSLDTGTDNHYIIALTPTVTTYTNGLSVKFRTTHANTGEATLNAGAGEVPLLRDDGTPLQAGDVPLSTIVNATYDATAKAFLVNTIVASQFNAISQSGSAMYSLDKGVANAYKAAYTPAVMTLTDGMELRFRAKNANTAASTFAPNALTPAPIWGGDHRRLTGGEIVSQGEITVQWNTLLNNGKGAWVLCENTGGFQKGPTPSRDDSSTTLATTQFVAEAGKAFIKNTGDTVSGDLEIRGNFDVYGDVRFPWARPTWRNYTPWDDGNFDPDSKFYSTDGRIASHWGTGNGRLLCQVDGNHYFIPIDPVGSRLKENIHPATADALETLKQIKISSFNFKENGFLDHTKKYRFGFIEQNLEQIDKAFVFSASQLSSEAKKEQGIEDETLLGPDQLAILACLVKGVQQLQTQIQTLQQEINILKTKLPHDT